MALPPVVISNGVGGWNFLKASLDSQTKVFESSADIAREASYFEDNIGDIKTLDDFMSDRRILAVALNAFGLSEEINKGAFVRKILEEGTEDSSAFAVRLSNSDYLEFANTFDFINGDLSLSPADVAGITKGFKDEVFEISLGTVDNSMRLALNFSREIGDLANEDLSEDAGWFKVMGSLPLRTVIDSAFNLPDGFAQLDIDVQKDILSDKANALFGGKGIDVFSDPEVVETAVRRYLLQEQIAQGPSASTPGFAALSILSAGQSSGLGSAGIANLLLSNVG